MRVVIAEDSVLLQAGLTKLLSDGGFEVVEAVAYFVVSEALTNVAKHADAGSAEVTVDRTGGRLRIVVSDDGRGGDTLDGGGAAADGAGSGLRGLAQRAAAVDGTLTVDSPPGGPTAITVELPCGS